MERRQSRVWRQGIVLWFSLIPLFPQFVCSHFSYAPCERTRILDVVFPAIVHWRLLEYDL